MKLLVAQKVNRQAVKALINVDAKVQQNIDVSFLLSPHQAAYEGAAEGGKWPYLPGQAKHSLAVHCQAFTCEMESGYHNIARVHSRRFG